MSDPKPVPRWVTVSAVLLVAGVAAVVSYSHMQEVAHREGEEWRSFLLPLSVDGLIVAASMVLLSRRRTGRPGGVLPWTALLGGVVASLAANVAAAEPTTTARIVAAWPAVAFAAAFELLLQYRPAGLTPAAKVAAGPGPSPEADEGETNHRALSAVEDVHDGLSASDHASRSGDHNGDCDALVARARALIAANGGHRLGRVELARELGCGEYQARQVVKVLDSNPGELPRTGADPAIDSRRLDAETPSADLPSTNPQDVNTQTMTSGTRFVGVSHGE